MRVSELQNAYVENIPVSIFPFRYGSQMKMGGQM